MLTILSPAKTLNMGKTTNTNLYSNAAFIKEAAFLIEELKNYSPPEMESLMKVNEELAETNFKRHILGEENHDISYSKQALLSYHGAVYQGINANTLKEEDLIFAQSHIRILSALYGVLRPLDLIQPYRLEMGTKLKTEKAKDLYEFWRDKLTDYFIKELKEHNDNALINLASNEYSSAIDMKNLNCNIITPIFKDYKNGSYKVITIYAKRARGLMTRFIIENKINNSEELKEFSEEGYSFVDYMSTDNQWVFLRDKY